MFEFVYYTGETYSDHSGEIGYRAFCTALFAQLVGGGSDVGRCCRALLSNHHDEEKE